MEYARARGKLPEPLDGLLSSQIMTAITEANLGAADSHMAQRYIVDRLPQIDIAVEMGLSEKTIGRHLRSAMPRIVNSANNIPQ